MHRSDLMSDDITIRGVEADCINEGCAGTFLTFRDIFFTKNSHWCDIELYNKA
jgi:hypothetical protein